MECMARLTFPFFLRPDGTEWYILYQARSVPSGNTGESESRNPRLQKIGWDADGMPDLGVPLPVNTPLPKPSAQFQINNSFGEKLAHY
mgnify:CR=1 FL=1